MTTDGTPTPGTKGLVMHSETRYYDLLAWLLTLGRERAFRERLVELAGLEPGDAVLDVGCGTGTLAIAAKRRVGRAYLRAFTATVTWPSATSSSC